MFHSLAEIITGSFNEEKTKRDVKSPKKGYPVFLMNRNTATPLIASADKTQRGLIGDFVVGVGVATGESAALTWIDCPGVTFPVVV